MPPIPQLTPWQAVNDQLPFVCRKAKRLQQTLKTKVKAEREIKYGTSREKQ